MVVTIDIDKFLTRDDFKLLVEAEWPWEITHFLLTTNCNCGLHTRSFLPRHFTISKNYLGSLLNFTFFWCQGCGIMSVYDHCISDECYYCDYSSY